VFHEKEGFSSVHYLNGTCHQNNMFKDLIKPIKTAMESNDEQ